jgi:hypothetical protein
LIQAGKQASAAFAAQRSKPASIVMTTMMATANRIGKICFGQAEPAD